MNRQKKLVAISGVALVVVIAGAAVIFRPAPAPLPWDVSERAQSVPARRPEPSRVDYRQLSVRIDALMKDPDMVGLAVGTIERGQVRFVKGYGETLANSGAAVTPDTVFRWASLSKAVAAALVVSLAEEGKLSLDRPVSAMGTTLRLSGAGLQAVTVADILSHRVGLAHHAGDDRLEAGEDPKLLRATLGSLPPACPPATCYAYQNIAFDTAAEIVEAVSGEDYATAAYRHLFVPLGMNSASIGRAGLMGASSWAQPHRRNRTPTTVNDNYYRVPAASGVNASIRDLVRWMGAQMGDAPAILSPEALLAMHRPLVSTSRMARGGPVERALSNAAYGLGWRSFTYAGHRLVGHRGSVDGYRSLILFDPADQSGIVLLWNSNHGRPVRLQLEFFDMLYGLPFTNWLELVPESDQPVGTALADEAPD
ncbi:serine hydrolase domain-containing protein [Polymorphobacter sp.]|uniref:serine hydrolase domain-containing protein n=1 Tax=Polymorphobacter sp. TaxID=1909290 RepID=UPI003F711144